MTAMQGALSAAERSMRSVFVGNIPYEATEEQLKDIFAEVGPVVSFRLVYDRETGKPKGYGFCEYKDQEMALSAMRNLNGYELNGRALRVDNAASEKSKEELKNLQASLGGPPVESPYGNEVPHEEAAEAIAKAVASLAPEQIFELMLQMKQCIENNPNEARNLLMQNPQLTFALLQAQVAMRLVTEKQAQGMLHTDNPFTMSATALLPTPEKGDPNSQIILPGINDGPPTFPTAMPQDVSGPNPAVQNAAQRPLNPPPPRPSLLGDRPIPAQTNQTPPKPYGDQNLNSRPLGDHDLRQMPIVDRDMRPPPMLGPDKDMRHPIDEDFRSHGGPGRMPDNRQPMDSRYAPNAQNIPHSDIRNMNSGDMRNMPPSNMRNMSPGDMRGMPPDDMRNMPPNDMHRMGQPPGRGMPPMEPPNMPPIGGRNMPPMDSRNAQNPGPRPLGDGRRMPLADPSNRGPMFDRQPTGNTFEGHRPPIPNRMDNLRNPGPMNSTGIRPSLQNPRLGAVGSESPAIGGASPSSSSRPTNNPLAAAAAAIAPHDQEKAALIMQVLQLSDQQIAMLPQEQRQSILILKEQIARSTQSSS